jgi:Spy/CpxP family protein refolding chaperone
MKKTLMVCAMVSLFAVSGAVWAAESGGKGGPGHRGGGMKGFGQGPGGIGWLVRNEDAAKDLGVTEDQLAKLRDMAYQAEITQIKTRADLELAQMELRRLLDGAKPTEEAVGKAVDKISGLEAQMQKARIIELLKAREILGEATMERIRDAMKARMRERREDREHERRGDHPRMGPRSDDDTPGEPLEKDDE